MNQTSFFHESNVVPNQFLIKCFINKLFYTNLINRVCN